MEYQKIECHSPKSCFRSAYQEGIIDYDEYWLKIIDFRNQTAHIYSEELADKIYQKLPKILKYLKDLFEKLK
ncbi:MAG: hypothetical protein KatS3mg094_243 [Candidatus Parcubacteria bacterium]|nr:MAG: hypothetical protein KatS3mg094_243 [Candidatus Parcubacteria bacterium]